MIPVCVSAGVGSMETSSHLFLHCNHYGSVWYLIYRWIGVFTVSPFQVANHFHHFSFLAGVSMARRSILHVVWFATMWEIWKERNNRLFNGKVSSIVQMVKKIKSLTFMWLKAKVDSLSLNYHVWWLSQSTILDIG